MPTRFRLPKRLVWDFLAVLAIFAGVALLPWAQGGTDGRAMALLATTFGFGCVLWLVGWFHERGAVRVQLTVLVGVVVISISGLISLFRKAPPPLNPHIREHQNALAERWPGVWMGDTAWTWFGVCVLCLMGLVVAADVLRRRPEYMRLTTASVIFSGSIVAVSGLFAGGAAEWMFRDSTNLPGHPFAGFFHYSFAGAYLNLVWPLAFALAVAPRRRDGANILALMERGFAITAGCLAFGAIWTLPTDAARALSLAILFILLLTWAEFRQNRIRVFWTNFGAYPGRFKLTLVSLALCLFLVASIAVTTSSSALERWGTVTASGPVTERTDPLPNRGDFLVPSEDPRNHLPLFDRRLAWATARSMLPDAGPWGFGPRAWKDYYTSYTDDLFLQSFFLYTQFVHNDWLQYLVEWGWLGGVGWIALWCFILFTGGREFWRRLVGRAAWTQPAWLAFAAWLGVSACLVHSQVDFPLQSPGILATVAGCSAIILANASHARMPSRPSRKTRDPAKSGLT